MSLLAASLCLALLPALRCDPGAAPEVDDKISLEELLASYRAERERLLAGFRAKINTVVGEMESAVTGNRMERLPELRASLVALGSQAAPLLVKQLDPGIQPSDGAAGRARQIALALREMSTRSVSVDLLDLLKLGSLAGQENALTALAGSDDPERVGPVLRGMFADAHKQKRSALIAAIANLGGPENFAFLGEVLTNQDPEIVKSVLVALTDSRTTAAAPKIQSLVRDVNAAAPHVEEILQYYRACPEVLDSDHCESLVNFAKALRSNSKMAELVLLLVGEHEHAWSSTVKSDLKALAEDRSSRIAEAALICLARAGDRNAKKDLLQPYDERIEKNDRIASAWQNRAEVKYRIGDYKSAIKDYETAHKVSAEYLRTEPEVFEGLARCYSLMGKLKDAAKWLGEGGLSLARLHQLAKDPEFAELAADEKYNRVFRLGED